MSNDYGNSAENVSAQNAEQKKKVSYRKTRDAVKNKYVPRHFSDAEPEKSSHQLRREKLRISIRRIKRLNLIALLLTIVLLSALFIGAGVLSTQKSAAVDPDAYRDKTLTVDFAGSVMMGRYIGQLTAQKGYDAVFHGVSAYLKNSDLAFANLSGAVLNGDPSSYEKVGKGELLSCTYEDLRALNDAGINGFALSNEHAYDYKNRPIEELIAYFRENSSIYYHGIGMNRDEATQYTIIDQNGYRIAFISITDVFRTESIARKEKSGVLSTAYGDYNRTINRASKNADITVVYCHWGADSAITRNAAQKNLGHQFIDAGADIVIGTRPGVLQEIEKYKDGVIFYSLGHFIDDSGDTFVRDSVLLEMTLDQKGSPDFTLIPIRINDGAPELTDNFFYKQRIYRNLTRTLDKDDYYTGDDNFIHVPLNVTYTRTADERAAAEASQPAPTAAPTIPASSQPAAPASEPTVATEPPTAAQPTETTQGTR